MFSGVGEGDLVGMEMVAAVSRQGSPSGWFRIDGTSSGSVEGISYEGITCRREVNADLMGATRQDVNLEQRAILLQISVKHPTFRVGRSALGSGGKEVADSGVRDPSDGCFYRKRIGSRDPTCKRPIDLGDTAFTQVFR